MMEKRYAPEDQDLERPEETPAAVRRTEGTRPRPDHRRPGDFSFIGSGDSDQGDLAPVSERHDEALAVELHREIHREQPADEGNAPDQAK